jgi:hypothetical protein
VVVLKEIDHPLSKPLQQSKLMLEEVEKKGFSKIIFLGDSKVGKYNVENAEPFLDKFKSYATAKNAPSARKNLFYLGIIAGMILSHKYTPVCQHAEMSYKTPHPADIKDPEKRITTLLKTVTVPEVDVTVPLLSLMKTAAKRRIEDIYWVKYAPCECCPDRVITTQCKHAATAAAKISSSTDSGHIRKKARSSPPQDQ